MKTIIRILKDWTLPVAMVTGIILYIILANVDALAETRHPVHSFVNILAPTLVFAQLLVTFCKISPRELMPTKWHIYLAGIQIVGAVVLGGTVILLMKDCDESLNWLKYSIEGAVVMMICPTATAAAVITGKLGGNAASLTTYTLISNISAATVVPLLFPLIEPSDLSFLHACSKILIKALELLIAPFILAFLLRQFAPKVQEFLASVKDLAFYLWAICLTCVVGMAAHVSATCDMSIASQCGIALTTLILCILLFMAGKRIGSQFNERISCGQALGQKNTTLAIWMTYAYLNPFAVIGPGSYIVWQNIINSYQLYLKRKGKLKQN